jgi:2-phospho-L-lactate guanylyltransferase
MHRECGDASRRSFLAHIVLEECGDCGNSLQLGCEPKTMFTALIPVKIFRSAKQRLSAVLGPMERSGLAAAMLVDTLELVSQVPSVNNIVVVTCDPDARKLALEHSADVFVESETDGLNDALERAASKLVTDGASGIVVLPTDVVLTEAKDLIWLLESHQSLEVNVTVATACTDFGTNCLVANPPSAVPFCFGKLSSLRHFDAANSRGYKARIVRIPNLDCDIDEVPDLRVLWNSARQCHSWKYLARHEALDGIFARSAAAREVIG